MTDLLSEAPGPVQLNVKVVFDIRLPLKALPLTVPVELGEDQLPAGMLVPVQLEALETDQVSWVGVL